MLFSDVAKIQKIKTWTKTNAKMKRIGNLYDRIIILDNLRIADDKARKGKAGIYGVKVLDKRRESNLLALHELLHSIRAYLHDNLKLQVKRNYQMFPVDARGIDFLGYVFFHTHTLLRKSIKQSLCRRVERLNKREKKPTRKEYKQSIASWWGWCKYCDSINLVRTLKERMPYEVRFTRT